MSKEEPKTTGKWNFFTFLIENGNSEMYGLFTKQVAIYTKLIIITSL